jgi:hypothetical protein
MIGDHELTKLAELLRLFDCTAKTVAKVHRVSRQETCALADEVSTIADKLQSIARDTPNSLETSRYESSTRHSISAHPYKSTLSN